MSCWGCPRCTLVNHTADAACNACGQARPAAPSAAQAGGEPEVIDLLESSQGEDEEEEFLQQQQQQRRQRPHILWKPWACVPQRDSALPPAQPPKQEQPSPPPPQQQQQQRRLEQQQPEQQQPEQQQQPKQQQQQQPHVGAVAMGSSLSREDAEEDEGSPSYDVDFQVQLSDYTSSRKRSTQGTAGSGSVQKHPPPLQQQQHLCKQGAPPVHAAAAHEPGSGSSAETAVAARAVAAALDGGGSAPLQQQQQQRQKPRLAVAKEQQQQQEPAGSVTSGSPAPRPQQGTAGNGRGGAKKEPQHTKRRRECGPECECAGPGASQPAAPAGLPALRLPASKKQRVVAAGPDAKGAAAAACQRQTNAREGTDGLPRPAKRAAGLSPLPPRHKKKKAGQQSRPAAAPPGSASGHPEQQQQAGAQALPASGAGAASAASPGKPSPRQVPPPAKGLSASLKPSKALGKRQREQQQGLARQGRPPRQQPESETQLAAGYPQQQGGLQRQPSLPVQASLRLPLRCSPTGRLPAAQGSTWGSPPSGWASASPADRQGQRQQDGSSPDSVALQRQESASPEKAGVAAAAAAAALRLQKEEQQLARPAVNEEQQPMLAAVKEEQAGREGVEEEEEEQQGVAMRIDPQSWWREMDVVCVRGMPAAPAASSKARRLNKPSAPAWVRRAQQSAQDITPALLAAAGKCPAVESAQHELPHPLTQLAAAPPGWLAYRVAFRLPDAAACRSGEDLLHLGAAAAAAAASGPPLVCGAALAPSGGGSAAGGQVQQQQQERQQGGEEAPLDMCCAAARLLASSRHQPQPLDLAERTRRWFSQRTLTIRKDLRQRLNSEQQQGGSASSAGGGRRGGATAAAADKRGRGPSRLRHGGGGEGGRTQPSKTASVDALHRDPPAGGSGRGYCAGGSKANNMPQGATPAGAAGGATGATRYRGVRHSTNGQYNCSVFVMNKQIWLGTFPSISAAARAVDLAWAWRWVVKGRMDAEPEFNLPQNNYLGDVALLRQLQQVEDPAAMKEFVRARCLCGAR